MTSRINHLYATSEEVKYVVKELRARRIELDMSLQVAGEKLAERIGVVNAENIISQYEQGLLYGTTSRISIRYQGRIYLNRLAHYIRLLDFGDEKRAAILTKIGTVDPRFGYPPLESNVIPKPRHIWRHKPTVQT